MDELVEITTGNNGGPSGVGDAVQKANQSTCVDYSLTVEQDWLVSGSSIVRFFCVALLVKLLSSSGASTSDQYMRDICSIC